MQILYKAVRDLISLPDIIDSYRFDDVEYPKVGDLYRCVEDVYMLDGDGNENLDDRQYTRGKLYECEHDGCLTDDGGDERHEWVGEYDDFKRYFVKC